MERSTLVAQLFSAAVAGVNNWAIFIPLLRAQPDRTAVVVNDQAYIILCTVSYQRLRWLLEDSKLGQGMGGNYTKALP